MSWKHLKALAIAVLLVLDAVLLIIIGNRNSTMGHYEDKIVTEAITVFRESGLIVQENHLDERILSYPAYTGAYDTTAKEALKNTLSSAGYTVTPALGGFSADGARGTLWIGDDFSIVYEADGEGRLPSTLYADHETLKAISNPSDAAGIVRAAITFFYENGLLPFSAKIGVYDVRLLDAYLYGNDVVLARICQVIDGARTESDVYLLIRGDAVIAADGVFAPVAVREKTDAACVGLLEILFAEKQLIDEQNRANGTLFPEYRILDKVEYEYMLYFDASGEFYWIPVCRLTYTSGENRLYQFMTGERLPDGETEY